MVNTNYGLVKDMAQTVEVIKKFNPSVVCAIANNAVKYKKIYFAGEGSSILFPAGRTVYQSKFNSQREWFFNGAREIELIASKLNDNLEDVFFILLSNSGNTSETVDLAKKLIDLGHKGWSAITAHRGSVLDTLAPTSCTLSSGEEHAVAATKSVIEQALICHAIFSIVEKVKFPDMALLAEKFCEQLETPIPQKISKQLLNGGTLYFAGPSYGVISELALKSAEIVRSRAISLPGTFCMHGIEEVMEKIDVLILCGSFEKEEQKIKEFIQDVANVEVISISENSSIFMNIIIPEIDDSIKPYIELAAGWNLLLSAGLQMKHDIDNPIRARKVGNSV